MSTLAQQLEALMVEHDLTCLSVECHRHTSNGRVFFGSYAHAAHRVCEGADDRSTPEKAITSAIAKANAKRGRTDVGVPQLEAA